MSNESMLSNLRTYMDMQTLGLYNNTMPLGYLGIPLPLVSGLGSNLAYSIPFSNVLSGVMGTLVSNGVNVQNIAGFQTINADSALQEELNKLGYGNMVILIPESYQKQVEENTENSQKLSETFKRWKANYDTVNTRGSQAQGSAASRERTYTGVSHDCSLRNCAFGKRV